MTTKDNKAIYLVVFLTLIMVVCTGLDIHHHSTKQPVNSSPSDQYIDVQASGAVKVSPDALDFPVNISASADTNELATSKAAIAAAKVRAVLQKFSIAPEDIATTSVVTNPVYTYNNNSSTLTGYQAIQSLDITIKNPTISGSLIDAVVQAGGNNVTINGATPELLDTSQATLRAGGSAIAQAKAKALAYAASLGVTLGKIISLTESPANVAPMPVMAMRAEATNSASTAINLGTQSVSVNVEARWSISH